MKQIDYLKLVATGRKSVHYARPSDADDALTGLVGYGFVFSLILTFAAAVLASFLGNDLEMETVGKPLATTILPGIAFFVCGFFIGGAPRIVRVSMIVIGMIAIAASVFIAIVEGLDTWYLYLPSFLYLFLVSFGAFRQM